MSDIITYTYMCTLVHTPRHGREFGRIYAKVCLGRWPVSILYFLLFASTSADFFDNEMYCICNKGKKNNKSYF